MTQRIPSSLGDVIAEGQQPDRFDVVGFIMSYEAGEIDDLDEVAAGFQRLIDCRIIWSLQGHYQRLAEQLIRNGVCHI